MSVVNTNVSASIAQAALARNERALGSAMEQLSTGRKINSAADNASGLAISTRMTSQIRGLDQAVRNANDATSMISTAEGALDEITSMLQRMRELAVQAGTGTTSSEDRSYLNQEYTNLLAEVERISANTQWNGREILEGNAAGSAAGSAVSFQVGMNPNQVISVTFGNGAFFCQVKESIAAKLLPPFVTFEKKMRVETADMTLITLVSESVDERVREKKESCTSMARARTVKRTGP